jgi:hypothetical protein
MKRKYVFGNGIDGYAFIVSGAKDNPGVSGQTAKLFTLAEVRRARRAIKEATGAKLNIYELNEVPHAQ